MKEITDKTNTKNDGPERESCKNLWMRFYEEELNDLEKRDLYLDCVDVRVETFLAKGHTEILGRTFHTWWSVEMNFLQWLKLYLNRGIGFEEAWFLAVKALATTEEGLGFTEEDLDEMGEEAWQEYEQYEEWYLDDEIYRPRVEAWTERLVDFGISKDKAEGMAEELVSLLREISFEQMMRPTDFWVGSGGSVNVA